jgi:hypothetical protein
MVSPRDRRVQLLFSLSPRHCEIAEAVDDFSVIPEAIEDYPVRSITDLFFCHCLKHSIPIPPFVSEIFLWRGPPSPLSRLEIPPSIEKIRSDPFGPAFARFSSLTELVFAPGGRLHTLLGFTECTSLSTIALPPSVVRVDAFNNCTALRGIVFSDEGCLRELHGFTNLPSLFQVTIPASVTIIRGFWGCPSLTEVTFAQPSALSEILGFNECCLLSRIEIPRSVERIAGFNYCRGLAHVTFAAPSCLNSIEGFTDCSSLRQFRIPARVHGIDEHAFNGCLSMAQVIFVDESGPQDSRYTIPSRFGELAERFEFEIVWVRRSTPEWEVLVRMSDSVCLVDRPRGDFSFVPPTIVGGGEIFEITMIAGYQIAPGCLFFVLIHFTLIRSKVISNAKSISRYLIISKSLRYFGL